MKKALLIVTILGLFASPLMVSQAEAAPVHRHAGAKHQQKLEKKHQQKRAQKHAAKRLARKRAHKATV